MSGVKAGLFCLDNSVDPGGVLISPAVGDNGAQMRRFHSRQLFPTNNNDRMHTNTTANSNDNLNAELSVDQKLVARAQKGDKKAFDLLVIKYQAKVASIVSRYVSDHHEIADVTQETFIKVYRALKGFRGDSAFYTWIYRIAINCAKNYLASKGRRPPAADIDIHEAEHLSAGLNLRDIASPESVLNKEQLERVVKRAIMGLPEDLRAALTLREFDGLSYDEISSVMNCPVGTVRSRIFRARESVDKEIRALTGNED